MAQTTDIEWTQSTWNPVRGCSRVSQGCVNCYAERVAARFSGDGKPFHRFAIMKNGEPHWTGKVDIVDRHLYDPVHWVKPRMIFVNSMSDLYHEELTFFQILAVHEVMMAAQRHTYQVLTKRPERAKAFYLWWDRTRPGHANVENLWIGVSVENQKAADERLPMLKSIPARIRWVSYEPALELVDFGKWGGFIDWIVIGSESGPGARPFSEEWARATRDFCVRNSIGFFYKQAMIAGKKVSTPELDGVTWKQYPGAFKIKESLDQIDRVSA